MERNTLEILLANDIPEPVTKQLNIKRLTKHCGQDVVFTVKQLPYDRVAEIKSKGSEDDMALRIVLAGLVDPDLKNEALKEKYGAPTAGELLKQMLLPGEIEDISREVEKLCGYRTITIEALKKKSEPTPTSA